MGAPYFGQEIYHLSLLQQLFFVDLHESNSQRITVYSTKDSRSMLDMVFHFLNLVYFATGIKLKSNSATVLSHINTSSLIHYSSVFNRRGGIILQFLKYLTPYIIL